MEPARLQKIIEPLEKMLSKKGFQIDGEPMVDGAVRMASFVRPDGVKVDYTLEVKHAINSVIQQQNLQGLKAKLKELFDSVLHKCMEGEIIFIAGVEKRF